MKRKQLLSTIESPNAPLDLIKALSELEQCGSMLDLKSIITFVNHKNAQIVSTAKRTASTIIRQSLLEDFMTLDKDSRQKLTLILDILHPDIITELINDINSSEESTQLNAIMILGLLRNRDAAKDFLEKIISLGGVKMRATALNSIVAYIGKDDLPIVVQRLQDEDSRVRANAVEVLEKLGVTRKNRPLHGQITADRIMAALKRVRHDEDSRVRANVLKAIFLLGEHSVTNDLVKMLESPNDRMVLSALWAIEELSATEDKICSAIKALLRHKSRRIRMAVKVLAEKPGFIHALERTEFEIMQTVDELDFLGDGLENSLTYFRFFEIMYDARLEVLIGLTLFARNSELLLQIWSLPPGKDLSVSFNHKMYHSVSGVNSTWVNAHTFTMTLIQFETALLIRDTRLIEAISEFDVSLLQSKNSALMDNTELHLKNSYLLMHKQDPNWEEEFNRAQKSATRRPKQFLADMTIKKDFLKSIFTKDQVSFEQSCQHYLTRYERGRQGISSAAMQWDNSVLFFLGWAAYASDTYGLTYSGSNDYAPQWLLTGELLNHPLVLEYSDRDASIEVENHVRKRYT